MAWLPACWHSDVNPALTGSGDTLIRISVALFLTHGCTKAPPGLEYLCRVAEGLPSVSGPYYHPARHLHPASRWDTSMRLHHALGRLCLTTAPREMTRGRAGDVCGETSITFTHFCVSSPRVVRQAACG